MTDKGGFEEEVRKWKMDLQEMGKVVKHLETELQKLKLQQASSSNAQGLSGKLIQAEIIKAKDLVMSQKKDFIDSKD